MKVKRSVHDRKIRSLRPLNSYLRITDFSVHVKTTLFINSLIIKRMMSKSIYNPIINESSKLMSAPILILNTNSKSGCL